MRRLARLFFVVVLAGCSGSLPEVCHPGQDPALVADVKSPIGGYHVFTHSHNDYEHDHPLTDALGNHFYSVEADIWFQGGKLTVSHIGLFPKGDLKTMYLDPLQARVDAYGSVYGDGLPFTLVVELKDFSVAMQNTLQALLDNYAMLSVATDTSFTPGPVTVVLTGLENAKSDFVARFPTRRAVRDSNDFHLDDPPADHRWTDYALDWASYLNWNGEGTIPAAQKTRLACIVANAHALGRRVRIYDSPETESAWSTELAAGVDFIGADGITKLSQFVGAQP